MGRKSDIGKDRITAIDHLLRIGLPQKDIAVELDISKSPVSRIV